MSSVNFEIVKCEDRIFFYDGEQYVLFDTGFIRTPNGKNSISASGKIGPFSVKAMPQGFISSFVNLRIDGKSISAVLNPMDGFNCKLEGNTLTVSDEPMEIDGHEYFFEFIDRNLPLVEGSINGQKCRLFFDSGARMTMFGERSLAAEGPVRTYREWMALKQQYADLEVFEMHLTFPNGFDYCGEGALVDDPCYKAATSMMNIRAMLGIDIFTHYDLIIIANGTKRGIALFKK